ncbi:AbrB/MazE/SpoVT family DNA-binding domain-containing protein [bacterium]|nr:AbrB/MazE/SpoVT family DNA-binding domain-containing protein [bacterium]
MITMTSKHQVTIPKKIMDVLGLGKGSIFDVAISENRIELIPLETIEKVFTEEEYEKLDMLSVKEKGKEKLVTQKLVDNLRKGSVN